MNDALYQSLRERFVQGPTLESVTEALERETVSSDDVATVLVELHNEHRIDLASLMTELRNSTEGAPRFFRILDVLRKCLPKVEQPNTALLRAVVHLQKEGAGDYVGDMVTTAYFDLLATDANMSSAALADVERSPEDLAMMIPGILRSLAQKDPGSAIEHAVRLCMDGDRHLAPAAVFAVTSLPVEGHQERTLQVATVLSRLAREDAEEDMRAALLNALSSPFVSEVLSESELTKVLAVVSSRRGALLVHAAASIVAVNPVLRVACVRRACFDLWVGVKLENVRTIGQIDLALARLIDSGLQDEAVHSLSRLLSRESPAPTIEQFKFFRHSLRARIDLDLVVALRWITSGVQSLEAAAADLIEVEQDGQRDWLGAIRAEVGTNRKLRIVAVRKCFGYYFLKPALCACLAIDLLESAIDRDESDFVVSLLFEVVLINYPRITLQVVAERRQRSSPEVTRYLQDLVARWDVYSAELGRGNGLAALQPSESQRVADHKRTSQQMQEAWKAAVDRSTLLRLIPRQILLFGEGAVTYVHEENAPLRRIESPLGSHSAGFDVARLAFIDPLGLDQLQRALKRGEVNL